jgi:hypothetical protein
LLRDRSESRRFVILAVPLAANLGCRLHRENDGARVIAGLDPRLSGQILVDEVHGMDSSLF